MNEIIEKYEKVRKPFATTALITLIIMIVGFVGGFSLTLIFQESTLGSIGGILLILGTISTIVFTVTNVKWKRTFAKNAVKEFIDSIYPGNVFEADRGLPEQVVMEPKFFHRPDRYLSSNYLRSSYGTTKFEMANYKLQRESHDDNGHTSYQTYAQGRFFVFDFERDFPTTLKVMEKTGIFNKINLTGIKKIELESIDFNKKFNTYCNDQVQGFYILTPQVQEKMLELEQMFKGQIYYCFEQHYLYVAVNDNKESLTHPVLKRLNEASIEKILKEIKIPMVFIDLLNLNRDKYNRDATI